MIKQNRAPFIRYQKQKQLLIKVTLMIYLNQYVLQFYQTWYKKYLEKGSGWITDSVIDHIINISRYKPSACGSYINFQKNRPSNKRFD